MLVAMQEALKPFIGCKVDVRANVGRKKIVPYEGVLEDIYPNLFVVRVLGEDQEERRMSFSYVDLLTGNVEMAIHNEGHTYHVTTQYS